MSKLRVSKIPSNKFGTFVTWKEQEKVVNIILNKLGQKVHFFHIIIKKISKIQFQMLCQE